jgi:hypothetical protein
MTANPSWHRRESIYAVGAGFPRFKMAGKLVDRTKALPEQHAAGRKLTDRILASSASNSFFDTMPCSAGNSTVSSRASFGRYMRMNSAGVGRRHF